MVRAGSIDIDWPVRSHLPWRAIQVGVFTLVAPPSVVPGVGISVELLYTSSRAVTAQCAGSTVLTDASGLAACDLIAGPAMGNAELHVIVAGVLELPPIALTVTEGPPATATILAGDQQSGAAATLLPKRLAVEIRDAGGNLLAFQPVSWNVEPAEAATLKPDGVTTDAYGRASAQVTLGRIAGTVKVTVRAGQASATFTETAEASGSQPDAWRPPRSDHWPGR